MERPDDVKGGALKQLSEQKASYLQKRFYEKSFTLYIFNFLF